MLILSTIKLYDLEGDPEGRVDWPHRASFSSPAMSVNEVLILAIRWLHNTAAVAWVGGGLFYLLVLRPRLKGSRGIEDAGIARDFRALVTMAMGLLLITGAILTFNRLTSGFVGPAYVITLVVKVSLAFYMFYLVRFLRRRTYPEDEPIAGSGPRRWRTLLSSANTVVALGVIVFLLADILRALFERGLKGG